MRSAWRPAPLLVIDLFKIGHDTLSIAAVLETTEAEALKRLTIQRSDRYRLPAPYERAPSPSRHTEELRAN